MNDSDEGNTFNIICNLILIGVVIMGVMGVPIGVVCENNGNTLVIGVNKVVTTTASNVVIFGGGNEISCNNIGIDHIDVFGWNNLVTYSLISFPEITKLGSNNNIKRCI